MPLLFYTKILGKEAVADGCRGRKILALCLDLFLHLVQPDPHMVGFGGVIFVVYLF